MEYTEVYAWGGDHYGQLGLGRTHSTETYPSPKCYSLNILISKISCGEEHSCFISDKGHIYTMGSNSEGRLGLGNPSLEATTSPSLVQTLLPYTMVDISCGWGHTLAVSSENSLFAWGLGEHGALGTGSLESQWAPAKVQIPHRFRLVQVAAGSRHSAALCEEGVLIWGSGDAGQLGSNSREKELTPVELTVPEAIKQVDLGVFHSLFLGASGAVYATGGNSFGQLGTGTKKGSFVIVKVKGLESVSVAQVAAGYHSACISDTGELFVWGTGEFGECLVPRKVDLPFSVASVSVGGSFGALVDSSRKIYTWGANSHGELGLSDFEPRAQPSLVSALTGKPIINVACGGSFCICLGKNVSAKRQTHYIGGTSPKTPHKREFGDSFEVQRLRKQITENRQDYDTLYKENQSLKDQLKTAHRSLNEYEHTVKHEFTHKFHTLREQNAQAKENYALQICELERVLEEKKVEYRQLDKDREIISCHNKRLEKALEEAEKRLAEARLRIQRLESDSFNQSREGHSAMQAAHRELHETKLSAESKSAELTRVQATVDELYSHSKQLERKVAEMDEINHTLQEELTVARTTIDSLRNELENTRHESRFIAAEWEQKHSKVQRDNQDLLAQIHSLEEKNQELFGSLQRELAQRAKEYKERTMSMLRSPARG